MVTETATNRKTSRPINAARVHVRIIPNALVGYHLGALLQHDGTLICSKHVCVRHHYTWVVVRSNAFHETHAIFSCQFHGFLLNEAVHGFR